VLAVRDEDPGAYGYSPEYPVARIFRDAPTYAMVEGSTNICKFIMARTSWESESKPLRRST
jgi:alkylation response protein AidB-like acyl-CoA dehydrogenase